MRPVLIDTSVWRAFFVGRVSAGALHVLLDEPGVVVVHPLVVGELVLGGLSPGQERLLIRLPQVERLSPADVISMIRRRRLMQRGIGWVDAELIASALAQRVRLWSLDVALSAVSSELGAAFEPNDRVT